MEKMFDKIRNIKMFDCFLSSSANNLAGGEEWAKVDSVD